MDINRNNYEAFFLLYADNELSHAEKKAVLVFIDQHPDLKPELELLQQAILKPTDIVFADKNSLLKKEVNVDEMQQNLLLLLDNETADLEKQHIYKLIATESLYSNEWNVLQQTKLHADTNIIFADKDSLYKKERDKVVGFNWFKIAAAAILIGAGIWGTIDFLIKKETVPANSIVVNTIKPATKNVDVPSIKNNITDNPVLKDSTFIKIPTQDIVNLSTKKQNSKNLTQPTFTQNKFTTVDINTDGKKATAGNSSENKFDNSSNKVEVSTVSLKKLDNEIISSQNDISINNKPTEKISSSIQSQNINAINVSLKENTDEESSDNHILFIPEEKLQKTKVGGLFNRVKQAIKNKANSSIRINI